MEKKEIGRWESRGGKYWIVLHQYANGSYGYAADNGGGYMAYCSLAQAMGRIVLETETWPSKAHRVYLKRFNATVG